MKIQKSSNACNLKQYRLRLKYTLWFGTDTRTEEMLWFSLPKIHLNTWSLLSKKRCAGLESFVACSICLVSNHTTYTVFRVEYDSEAKRVGDIPTVPAPGKAKNLAKSWWSGITKEACRVCRNCARGLWKESWSKINNWLLVSILRYSKVFGSEMLGFSPHGIHWLIIIFHQKNWTVVGIPLTWTEASTVQWGWCLEFSITGHLKVSAQSHESSTIQQEGLLQTVRNEVGNDDC